jgi:hypothetical protein
MFEDAQRFLTFAESGIFPRPAISGKEEVMIVISKTRYPTTKDALINRIGWKLVELEDRKQIKLAELLKQLSHSNCDNPNAVIKELKL